VGGADGDLVVEMRPFEFLQATFAPTTSRSRPGENSLGFGAGFTEYERGYRPVRLSILPELHAM